MKFRHLILRKTLKFVATGNRMLHFKANMHQSPFRLALRPRSRQESLQHSPRPSSWI